MCSGKMGHQSQEQADDHRFQVLRRTGSYMRAYRCSFCKLWHVGHVGERR